MLTDKHAQIIKSIAESPDKVSLYESSSLSGDSMTLRYSRTWLDRYYNTCRTYTGMIFSVKVYKPLESNPDAKLLSKFNAMVSEAKTRFEQYRLDYINSQTVSKSRGV